MKSLNYWKYRIKYLLGRRLSLKTPVDISLELSSFCNMHCTYCLDPSTPVLRSDLTWKPIGEIKEGEKLVAFDEMSGPNLKNRSMRESVVEKVWTTEKPTLRISTSLGSVTCSTDHKFLNYIGRWLDARKLKEGDRILFSESPWEAPTFSKDYARGYLLAMTVGDGSARWKPLEGNTGKTWDSRRQVWWRIALIDRDALDRIRDFLDLFQFEHNGIKGFSKSDGNYQALDKIEIRKTETLKKIEDLIFGNKEENEDFYKGYLAGIFDAEGSFGQQIVRISQKQENDVCERVMKYMSYFGFDSVREKDGVRLRGGVWENLRFFGLIQPAIKRKLSGWIGIGIQHRKATILKIEKLGTQKLVDIQTSTKTFYANGFATHNCYHADKKNLPFKMNYMSWETAHKILTQAAELEVASVKMNWRGESTMNPNFSRICEYAKQNSTGTTFIDRLTNSNFKFDTLNDDIFRGLACQTKVKISYDSFQKDIFEKQRLGGNHDITTRNIDKFYNWPGRETEIVIQAVRTQRNKDEDFEGETRKRWPSANLSIRDVVEGRLNKDIGDILVKKRDLDNRQSCYQAHVRLIFDSNGRASPCCPDIKNELVVGDIHKQSLYEIFNSEFARQLRKDLNSGKAFESSPCKNCSSHETFKGYKPSWVS